MMYAKKCIVEKENASLHQMEHSLILVNAILVGNKQLLIMMIIPSFSLAFFPIVRLMLLVQLLLLLCKKRKPKQIDLFLISAVGLIAVVDHATRHHRLRMTANVQRVILIFLMSLSSRATENVRLDWIVQTLGSPRRINLLPQHHHLPKTMRIELGRSC